MHDCPVCHLTFLPHTRNQKCCSPQCKSKDRYQSTKVKRLAFLKERRVPKSHVIMCSMCGEEITAKQGVTRYCPTCSVINNKALKRDCEHRRRARKMGAAHERISVSYIYERDAWRCGICHKRVDKALAYPHRMSASLDHVVPLAHGGTHTKANVQLAHWICNCKKSDSLNGVQPLLFG